MLRCPYRRCGAVLPLPYPLTPSVVYLRNGSYGLVEIKLGGTHLISEGCRTLKTLSERIDTDRMKAPSFLMVLTGIGDIAYRRKEDGIYIVPIGCLKQ